MEGAGRSLPHFVHSLVNGRPSITRLPGSCVRAFAAEHEALLPAAVVELQQQCVGDLAGLRAA